MGREPVRAHRNEDLLLGEMTRRVHLGGWSLDLPWGLPHWRSPAKRWLQRSANFRQEPAHFLIDYLDQTASRIASDHPRDRMHALAAIVLDLAATPESHLVELLEQQAADTASRVQFAIAAAQDDADVPAAWKDMLRPWVASPTLSIDPAIVRDRLASPAAIRAMAKHYGNALALWPQLWDWAREWASAHR